MDVKIGPKGDQAKVFVDIQKNSGDVGTWNTPDDVGRTFPLSFDLDITACKDNGVWRAELVSATGWYFVKVDVTHVGLQNITGPPFADSCKQIGDLQRYGQSGPEGDGTTWTSTWYSNDVVLAHEKLHEGLIAPTFSNLVSVAAAQVAQWSVPDVGQGQAAAIQEMSGHTLDDLEITLLNRWIENYRAGIAEQHGNVGNDPNAPNIDPNAPTTIAENGEIDKLLASICNWRKGENPPLPPCPEAQQVCGP